MYASLTQKIERFTECLSSESFSTIIKRSIFCVKLAYINGDQRSNSSSEINIRVQGSVTSQDNPPPEAKKVGFIPPLKKSRSGQLSPLWKSSDQDKMHPLREILRAERAKKRHFGAVLTWKFFQTRTIPPLERKFLMQIAVPPWHNFRSGQLSPPLALGTLHTYVCIVTNLEL